MPDCDIFGRDWNTPQIVRFSFPMSRIPIFLINLDRSKDRWQFMQQQAQALGLEFERVPAVEGRNLPEWLKSEFCDDRMSAGQIGCYASHLVIASMIVGRGLQHAIILEDDATLVPEFLSVAGQAVASAPQDWDYIHLSSNFKKSVIKVAGLGDHALIRYVENPSNTAAYILSNRGARKWLKPMPRVRPNDLDNRFAWQQDLKIYGVYPALATQREQFASELGRPKVRPRWEPGPLVMLGGRLWNMREIGVRNYVLGAWADALNSFRKRVDGRRRVAVLRDVNRSDA